VYGCIIEGAGPEKTRNFKQQVTFDTWAKTDIMKIIGTTERSLHAQLEDEEIRQRNLPKNFRDHSKVEALRN
jgi:hypothetical protein